MSFEALAAAADVVERFCASDRTTFSRYLVAADLDSSNVLKLRQARDFEMSPEYTLSTHLRILTILLRLMGIGSLITAAFALLSFAVKSDRSVTLLAIGVACAFLGVALLVVRSPKAEDVERLFGKRTD